MARYVDDEKQLVRLYRLNYDKGYVDGRSGRDAEIVRCKDCKWFDVSDPIGTTAPGFGQEVFRCKRVTRLFMEPDAFCSYGERREERR